MTYEYITTPEHARRIVQEALDAGDVHRRQRAAGTRAVAGWGPDCDAARDYELLYSILELAEHTRFKQPRHVPGYVARRLTEAARGASVHLGQVDSLRIESFYEHLVEGNDPKAAVKLMGEDLAEHYLRLLAERMVARSATLI